MKKILSLFVLCLSLNSQATCTLSVPSVDFGSYDILSSSPTQSSFIIGVQCSPSQTITLYTTGGNTTNYSARYLLDSALDQLSYNIYLDSARTVVWGGTTLSGAYSGPSGNITFYTNIPAHQNVPAGVYTDSLIIRLVF